jgi:hypothetical protein
VVIKTRVETRTRTRTRTRGWMFRAAERVFTAKVKVSW